MPLSWLLVAIIIVRANFTSDRRQSEMLLTTDECKSTIASNSVFDCHLLSVGQKMANEIYVSNEF